MQRRSKATLIGLAVLVAAGLVYLGVRGSHDNLFEGTLQVGFERSDFYPSSDCSAFPYWYSGSTDDSQNLRLRWKELGSPPAMRVKFRGDLSSLGLYGHLGKYWREIRSTTILEAKETPACQKL